MDNISSNIPELSIVLATLNEIENLPKLIEKIDVVIKNLNISYQYVFVDDNSNDGTRDFITKYCKDNPSSKYIFNQSKRSTLIARYQGITQSEGKYIVIMDADLQHPPEYLDTIYQELSAGNNIVSGSRYLKKGGTGNRYAIRGVISRIASLLAHMILKTSRSVTDPLSCYIGFNRSLKVDIDENWRGYEIGIFIRASNPTANIKEIPYRFSERENGKSKVTSNLKFVSTYLKELILAKKIESKNIKACNRVQSINPAPQRDKMFQSNLEVKLIIKKKLLIVSDPLCKNSVQLNLLNNVINELVQNFDISVYSTYIAQEVRKKIGTRVKIINKFHSFLIYRLYRSCLHDNESILWFLSWIREALFKRNSKNYEREIDPNFYDIVINLAQTIPAKSNIHWGQSVPLDDTLSNIKEKGILHFTPYFVLSKIGDIDRALIRIICSKADIIIANSRYTRTNYEKLGVNVRYVIYSVSDLLEFTPSTGSYNGIQNKSKYVLAYIGKETEIDTVLSLAYKGLRVVTFGAKVPPGIKKAKLKEMTDFRGFVTREELIALYSNAHFTVFPFTYEPFGYVPLESIACGTPVLTYGKQGPSETIVDGRTGWLVDDRKEFIDTAVKLWRGDKLCISDTEQEKARSFSRHNSDIQLSMLISPQNAESNFGYEENLEIPVRVARKF
jgi:glycosyltransferase involved in cell wall biosynthesis